MATGKGRERRKALPISSIHILPLDQLEAAPVRLAATYWRALRAADKLPARSQLSPREMAGFLRNIVLVQVIGGGADYEYRIVGDAHVQAFGANFSKLRSSDIERTSPEYGAQMRSLYAHVRSSAEPYAVCGRLGRDVNDRLFVHHETAFLPVGEDHATVDHILIASAYVPKLPDCPQRSPGLDAIG